MQISVIVPSYKPQDYIFECLESLVKQTLSKDLWEVIIILNGCNEPWYSMLNDYIKSHNFHNARLIQTDIAGVSNARNIGLDKAQGEYITFIDDDDYVSDVYLERLLQIATPNIIGASNMNAFSQENSHIPHNTEKVFLLKSPIGIQPFYKVKRYFGGPCMKLIHRNIIGETRYDTRFSNGEDSLFMFAISCRMKYIDFTSNDAIYYRRIRPYSATSQPFFPMLINRFRLFLAYNRCFIKNHQQYNLYFYLTRILACFHIKR